VAGPKVLRIGLLTPITTLDPKVAYLEGSLILRQMLEPVYDIVPGAEGLVPVLFQGPLERLTAGSAPIYRAAIRPGVFFSDGVALTAAHVAGCLGSATMVKGQATVAADGDYVVFHLKRPVGRFEAMLSHTQCYVRRHAPDLVGTGPFMRPRPGTATELRLVKNPRYRQPVALDEVVFKVYPLDAAGRPTALLEALQRGEVDATSVLPRDEANRVSGVRKTILPSASTALLFFNVESPRLADVRLRRALALSVVRQEFAADAYANALAFKAPSLLPRSLAVAEDGLDYDPARARALLAAAGLKAPARLSVVLTWAPRPYLPDPERAFEILSRQLGVLGIALDAVRTSTVEEYYDRIIEGQQDLTLAGWVADTPDPCDFLESCLASDRVPTRLNVSASLNNARIRNPALDQALAEYRADSSPARLEAVMAQLRELVPLVPLMYGSTCMASSFRVSNLKASPNGIFDLSTVDLTG